MNCKGKGFDVRENAFEIRGVIVMLGRKNLGAEGFRGRLCAAVSIVGRYVHGKPAETKPRERF
jgi:hypothetical protein